MRFDLLFAVSNSGLYAALALMIGGFVLAVGGLTVLLWRRKKLSKPTTIPAEVTQEAADTPIAQTVDAPVATAAPAAPEGRRRRSLVGGAERDSGTPAGAAATQDEPAVKEALEAEFTGIETNDHGEAHDANIETEETESELEVATEPTVETASVAELSANAEDDEIEAEEAPVEEQSKADEPETQLPAEILAARANPIVFRQFLPQSPGKDGLSFYGGKPIGPAEFEWPRTGGGNGDVPLTFIMQWECSQLSGQDATGLLPEDGVLYCFLNLDWGSGEEFIEGHRFFHLSGPTDGWVEIDPPADAPPVFGTEGAWQMNGCTNEVDNADAYVPRIMPRFPFEPIAFDYPMPEMKKGELLFWTEEQCAEAVLAAQKMGIEDNGEISDIDAPKPGFGRPFPAFPHDFGAIRTLAAVVLNELRVPDKHTLQARYPDLSEEELDAQFASWREEAKELYQLGCQRPIGHPVDQNIADDIWQWVEDRQAIISLGFHRLVEQSVDLSLGVGSEALAAVPENLINQAMQTHAFASEYMTDETCDPEKHGTFADWSKLKEEGKLDRVRRVHSPIPEHMFGPPSYVQGYVEEMIDDHLLLLELTGYSGPEHHFGEGVLQYLIKPDDLAARRFDQVKSVLSGY